MFEMIIELNFDTFASLATNFIERRICAVAGYRVVIGLDQVKNLSTRHAQLG
jgi:hypothetical protein